MSVQLLQGDCLELIKNISDGSVDMVLTSPPYDNAREYNGNIRDFTFEKFKQIAVELFRVVKNGGIVVWIVSDVTINGSETGSSFKQALWFMNCGFNLHDTMIWKKQTVFQHKCRYIGGFEYMFVFSKGKPLTTNLICDRKNKWAGSKIHGTERMKNGETKAITKKTKFVKEFGARTNIWEINEEKKNKTKHPAVFPVKLATDHLISWSRDGDTILDCFMGSGTTGVACLATGRSFIGMEIDQEYFEIAKKRIEGEK